MPCVRIETSKKLSETEKKQILREMTTIISEVLCKPKLYIMGVISEASVIMSDSFEPAMFIVLKSIGGLSNETNTKLSEAICNKIYEIASIPEDRIFLNFVDVERANWGWNGSTLG